MYAPKIDNYIYHLSHRNRGNYECNIPFDDKSMRNIDEIFKLVEQIKPTRDDEDVRDLWLVADRGTIDDFGNYDEFYEDGAVESREEFEEQWHSYYPTEKVWYTLCTVERKDSGFRAIFLNHKLVIEIDPRRTKVTFEEDASELTDWLLEQVKNSIAELRAGTYNERIQATIPCSQRTGTILRKDLWDIFPEWRTDFFEDLTKSEIDRFVSLVSEQYSGEVERMEHLTVNGFFELCALGYKANNYEGTELTPREQYYLHADGRDDGLGEIDADSEEAFIDWLNIKHKIGHPWEVCRGGNSTHISLYVWHKDNGFELYLAGSATTRTIETVKFYLALRNKGIPVYLRDGQILATRLLETERIGVVPDGITPVYCESLFPGEKIISFMNLPYENTQLVADRCVWQDLKRIELESE